MNISALQDTKQILGIMLFGSTARRDTDAYSDKDIFVLFDDIPLDELLQIKHRIVLPYCENETFPSCYKNKDALLMAEHGSLFLWHLKLEGRIVFSKRNALQIIFASLKPYINYRKDLECYQELLQDVEKSIERWNTPNAMDIALLFTIARNVCILLCHKNGTPKFGRSNAYLKAKSIFGDRFPLPEALYQKLCSCKLWYERGICIETNILSDLNLPIILSDLRELIRFAGEYCL
ncbi:MAG: nucleotidyltransferase domain-containing protein [Sedimentisphaerales bacterium]|jgi:predicted nucleotidyltransferase